MDANTTPAAETLTALQDAERCIEITAGILDDDGYVELALLCLDQAGLGVSEQDSVRRVVEMYRQQRHREVQP